MKCDGWVEGKWMRREWVVDKWMGVDGDVIVAKAVRE
jgi:hypothetical protein